MQITSDLKKCAPNSRRKRIPKSDQRVSQFSMQLDATNTLQINLGWNLKAHNAQIYFLQAGKTLPLIF